VLSDLGEGTMVASSTAAVPVYPSQRQITWLIPAPACIVRPSACLVHHSGGRLRRHQSDRLHAEAVNAPSLEAITEFAVETKAEFGGASEPAARYGSPATNLNDPFERPIQRGAWWFSVL